MFFFSKDPKKPENNILFSTKILSSTTVFNINNNNKCFLSTKPAFMNDFEGPCDTEDWINAAKNSALPHKKKKNYYILK